MAGKKSKRSAAVNKGGPKRGTAGARARPQPAPNGSASEATSEAALLLDGSQRANADPSRPPKGDPEREEETPTLEEWEPVYVLGNERFQREFEEREADRREAERQTRDEGKLFVPLPLRARTLPNGQTLTWPEHWENPLLRRLSDLRSDFNEVSRRTANEETTAVAVILTALVRVVRNPEALAGALNEPYKWAAKIVEPAEPPEDMVVEAGMPPLLDALGRLPPKAPGRSIAPGFDYLVEQLVRFIRWGREARRPLHEEAEAIADIMASAFRGIDTLAKAAFRRDYDAATQLRERVRQQLVGLVPKLAPPTVEAASAAVEIAEHLVRFEMRMSAWTEQEITQAFRFLETRASRSGKH